MQARMTKNEVGQAGEALIDWFASQDISIPNAAIVMIHVLGVMTGDRAKSVPDLKVGSNAITAAITGTAARAFCIKHGIDPDNL